MVGLALAVVAFANIIFLILADIISANPNPYIGHPGLYGHARFPHAGLVAGGCWYRARARPQSSGIERRFTISQIDLNNPKRTGPTVIERRLCW
jgi:hypothetical protein